MAHAMAKNAAFVDSDQADGVKSGQSGLTRIAFEKAAPLFVVFLNIGEFARLQCVSRSIRRTINQTWVWKAACADWRRRPRLLMWPNNICSLDSRPCASRCWQEYLRRNTVRCELSLKLFLPDMLGYSLIQPKKAHMSKQVTMTLSTCVDCQGVRKLEEALVSHLGCDWQLLVTESPKDGLNFLCPYKTYWLHSQILLMASSRRPVAPISSEEMKSFSLNAQTVCELDQTTALASSNEDSSEQMSEMQRQMLAESSAEFSFVSASPRHSSNGTQKSTWIIDGAQASERNAKYFLFYLVNSSTNSSKIRVDRICAAVHKDEWSEVLSKC